MRSVSWQRLIAAVLIGATTLAGCAGGVKTVVPASPTALAGQKPPLNIPKQFESEEAKQSFAIQTVDQGYYREASTLLEETLANHPDATAYLRLGTARYNLNNYTGAIEAWTKAAESDPRMAGQALNNTANALRDSKRYKEAEDTYRKVLSVEPSRSSAAINLAVLLKEQGKVSDAIAVLENSAPDNPKDTSLTSLLHALKTQAASKNG